MCNFLLSFSLNINVPLYLYLHISTQPLYSIYICEQINLYPSICLTILSRMCIQPYTILFVLLLHYTYPWTKSLFFDFWWAMLFIPFTIYCRCLLPSSVRVFHSFTSSSTTSQELAASQGNMLFSNTHTYYVLEGYVPDVQHYKWICFMIIFVPWLVWILGTVFCC